MDCVKRVRIRIFFGPYSVQMRENTDRENSENRHFSRSDELQCYSLEH